jgi:hypothetical protein
MRHAPIAHGTAKPVSAAMISTHAMRRIKRSSIARP